MGPAGGRGPGGGDRLPSRDGAIASTRSAKLAALLVDTRQVQPGAALDAYSSTDRMRGGAVLRTSKFEARLARRAADSVRHKTSEAQRKGSLLGYPPPPPHPHPRARAADGAGAGTRERPPVDSFASRAPNHPMGCTCRWAADVGGLRMSVGCRCRWATDVDGQ